MAEIVLYNSLSRQKERFESLQPHTASVYACGPTVYHYVHIGNLRTYTFVDLLRRTLEKNGYQTRLIMNITDVGHLTNDTQDEGEDKMIVAMLREGKTAHDVAAFYTQAFFRDAQAVNLLPATVYPRATEHIAAQVKMIEQLEQKGYTYRLSDGIYFDTSRFPDYGALSRQNSDEKQMGARVDAGEKRHTSDFALWKFSPATQERQMEWSSPWGKGFPGWHIEWSAMSVEYLGAPFDIHAGGHDLLFVHHENEIAQTKAALSTDQARVWMHGAFITVDGGKMSKSLGNGYTVSDLVERGFDPMAFRYLLLTAHYRSLLNFTFEALEHAQNGLNKLRHRVREWSRPSEAEVQYEARFLEAINDDLNFPKAIALVWELVDDQTLVSAKKSATLLSMDEVLGLRLGEVIGKPQVTKDGLPKEILHLLGSRDAARARKDWVASDQLRQELEEAGYVVEDTPAGTRVRPL